jgi:hypothetical protein
MIDPPLGNVDHQRPRVELSILIVKAKDVPYLGFRTYRPTYARTLRWAHTGEIHRSPMPL